MAQSIRDETNSVLNQVQIDYLKVLNENPIFRSIIDVIAAHGDIPTYRPMAGEPDAQYQRWVYQSGVLHDREQMVLLLSNGRRGLRAIDTEE